MERFEGPFHQSDTKAYLKCPRSFYFNRVLNLDKEKVNMSNLAGRAGHATLEFAHGKGVYGNQVWDSDKLFAFFLKALEQEKNNAVFRGMTVDGQIKPERYKAMLTGYASKEWNREAKILAMEEEFFFEIKPSKTTYQFAGRIDQLVEIETDLLRADFPEQFKNITKPTVILHRDTKFGRRRECSRFELALDAQFDIYSYALKYGVFTDDILGLYSPNIIPDFHVKYHLEDHIPYESDAGPYLKDPDTGGRVPCDIVAEPCLVGKKQKPCEGKRAWCTKQRRGPGMYFTTRPLARLKEIPKELMSVCASIRMGHYPRQLGELCHNYCQYRSVCEAEVLQAIEAETETETA